MAKDNITNLSRRDWYLLRDAVLGASSHRGMGEKGECHWYTKLPERLKQHEVGKLVEAALYRNNRSALNKAAKLLTGGIKNPWLALDKS